MSLPKQFFPRAMLSIMLFFTACLADKKDSTTPQNLIQTFQINAHEIQDSFQVSVQLPTVYKSDSSTRRYPMVLVTDADLYFGMLAPIVHQYERIGLMEPVVLVGIGYGSIQKMDSLRTRDFLYPKAIASDEMEAPGGGQKFYDFICSELLPHLDQNYRLNGNRLLMGHSFGANFSLLSMQIQRQREEQIFRGFVAASPALWYNDFYLVKQQEALPTEPRSSKLFLTVGNSEDKQWNIDPVKQYAVAIRKTQTDSSALSVFLYPDMTHMETGLVSMLQGIIAHLRVSNGE